MRLLSLHGNVLHAPSHSRMALMSAYTSGCDALLLEVQRTADRQLVLCASDSIEKFIGQPGLISELTLEQLNAFDFSRKFQPRHSPTFSYYNPNVPGRRLNLQLLAPLLRYLPSDIEILLRPNTDDNHTLSATCAAVSAEGLDGRVIWVVNSSVVGTLRQVLPQARVVLDWSKSIPNDVAEELRRARADGLLVSLDRVLDDKGRLTELAQRIKAACSTTGASLGAILIADGATGIPSAEQLQALERSTWVWGISSASMLESSSKGATLLEESFSGKSLQRKLFALGYAKANPYAHVYQDDGVHVNIAPYEGKPVVPTNDLERRLLLLEEAIVHIAKDWPYYSGGGVGVLESLIGDFIAEVDYSAERVCQASTLEMAVVNADPGTHVEGPPRSFRDKDIFYDPHGAPPFVGVEHDEDDGYRINWNYGTDYDNNGYGRPAGNGTALSARLRLERRGAYFCAYYKNSTDAKDWVCVGETRNDSMNQRVFLRCVAKRWRQENPASPTTYFPIVPNHFIFTNLHVHGRSHTA